MSLSTPPTDSNHTEIYYQQMAAMQEQDMSVPATWKTMFFKHSNPKLFPTYTATKEVNSNWEMIMSSPRVSDEKSKWGS